MKETLTLNVCALELKPIYRCAGASVAHDDGMIIVKEESDCYALPSRYALSCARDGDESNNFVGEKN